MESTRRLLCGEPRSHKENDATPAANGLPSLLVRRTRRLRQLCDTDLAQGQATLMHAFRYAEFGTIVGMEIRHLQSFVVAAEKESFTRAGEILGLSQAAVSQHVAAMEMQLRVGLFKRGPKSVSLTDTGRRVYDHARRILDLVEEINQTAGHEATDVTGTLRIASSSVPSEWLLPQLLVKFRDICPEVDESVTVSDSAAAIQAVESGKAEIGLVGELPRAANLCAKSIAQDELMLVVASDHSFVEGSRRTSGNLPRISNGTN